MIPLLFFFWIIGADSEFVGRESRSYKDLTDCAEARVFYSSEGETTSQCYARLP